MRGRTNRWEHPDVRAEGQTVDLPPPAKRVSAMRPIVSGRDCSCCRARTCDEAHVQVKLYSNLLDYVISAALIFYILTIAGVFRLRRTRPDADRPYRAFGYPLVPALYIGGAATILAMLFVYRTATTWPGLIIVLLGVPVYLRGSRVDSRVYQTIGRSPAPKWRPGRFADHGGTVMSGTPSAPVSPRHDCLNRPSGSP